MRASLLPLPVLLLAMLLPAQDAGSERLPRFLTPIHTQADDPEGGAYGIWGAGADYKASFHDGATFVPYLGGDYPVTQTWRWRTTSVTVGTHELATHERPLGRQVGDARYEYDLGGVVEAYDVRLEGLEQTFVVRQAVGDGDLVVRGAVLTALRAAPAAARHAAVVFADEQGVEILGYGAATAVDAAGRRCAMTTAYAEGAFELRLDGAWLRDAAWPVTVDPVITVLVLDSWTGGSGSPLACDAAYDPVDPTYRPWFAFTRSVSATDSDLWIARYANVLGSPFVVPMFVDVTTAWGNDTCVLARASSWVVGAFGRVFGGSTPTRNIRWHAHRRDDYATRTGFGSFGSSTNNWRVDIGAGYDSFFVVFQHESGLAFANGNDSQIRAFTIDMFGVTTQTGQGTATFPITLFGGPTVDCERPRTGKVGLGTRHCVVYQWIENQVPNDDWDVHVDYWQQNGTFEARTLLEPGNVEHKLGPVVSGTERALVTYNKAPVTLVPGPTTSAAGYSVTTQRVDYDYLTHTITLPHPKTTYLTSATRSLEVVDSDHDSSTISHWLQVVRDGNVYYADQLGYQGLWMSFALLFAGTAVPTTYPAAAGVCFSEFEGQFFLVHAANVAGSHPVMASYWNGATGVWPPRLEGIGCSSAVPSWPDTRVIGSEFPRVSVSNLPPNWPAAVALSFGTASAPLAGVAGFGSGCTLLIDPFAPNWIGLLPAAVSDAAGIVRWQLPLPESVPPGWLYFQALHPDAGFVDLLVTQRLEVLLTY